MNIEKIKAAALAATQGEWYHSHGFAVTAKNLNYGMACDCEFDTNFMSQNATYIATANPSAVLELIDRLEAAEDQWRICNLHVTQLETKLEAAERDAERYRWLRDSDNQLHEDDPSVADSFFNVYFDSDLDDLIDKLIIRMEQWRRSHEYRS